jgi:hypothetical protein
VEQGTHAELMRIDGLYSTFYRMQFKEEVLRQSACHNSSTGVDLNALLF